MYLKTNKIGKTVSINKRIYNIFVILFSLVISLYMNVPTMGQTKDIRENLYYTSLLSLSKKTPDITFINVFINPITGLKNISEVSDLINDINEEDNIEIYQEEIIEEVEEEIEPENINDQLGNSVIEINDSTLVMHDLPSKYYPGLDFSSFQPYMGYTKITNKGAPAYAIVNSELSYTDEFGLRRYKTNESQFTVDGADDYIIALGTFYKDKGLVGNRYLIVTTTGMYTAITGDEKADAHTDSMNMFSMHCNGTKAGIIEWIVDQPNLHPNIRRAGTVTQGGPEVLSGEITHIYEIQ